MLVNQILSLKGDTAPNIVTIPSSATVEEAVKLLGEKRIGAIVVTTARSRSASCLSAISSANSASRVPRFWPRRSAG